MCLNLAFAKQNQTIHKPTPNKGMSESRYCRSNTDRSIKQNSSGHIWNQRDLTEAANGYCHCSKDLRRYSSIKAQQLQLKKLSYNFTVCDLVYC